MQRSAHSGIPRGRQAVTYSTGCRTDNKAAFGVVCGFCRVPASVLVHRPPQADKPRKPPVNNNERQRRVSNASNALDNTLHVAACSIVAHALATGSAIILEDLTGMSRGWVKFNKRTRNRLNAAAMLKFQRLIYEKARWHGVEVIWIHPRDTSALCCICKTRLSGDYSYRTCRHCVIRVDRDVNAVHNMLRITAAARYGQPRVWPSPNEARALPDIILDHVRVTHEGGSLRVDGENGDVWV